LWLCRYQLIGLIVATISGFEHRGLVMRRKYVLTGESRQEDLRAIFAFRAHTPEGHVVERIGVIADVICAHYFRAFARWLSVRPRPPPFLPHVLTGYVSSLPPY
jgi:hypothetical protein